MASPSDHTGLPKSRHGLTAPTPPHPTPPPAPGLRTEDWTCKCRSLYGKVRLASVKWGWGGGGGCLFSLFSLFSPFASEFVLCLLIGKDGWVPQGNNSDRTKNNFHCKESSGELFSLGHHFLPGSLGTAEASRGPAVSHRLQPALQPRAKKGVSWGPLYIKRGEAVVPQLGALRFPPTPRVT